MEASQSTITIAVVSPTCNKALDRARAIHIVIRIHIEEFLCRLDSVSSDNLVHNAQFVGLRRRQLLRLEHNLQRFLSSDDLHETRAAAPAGTQGEAMMDEADVALLRVCHNAEVRRSGHLRAASDSVSLDQRDAHQSQATEAVQVRLHQQVQLDLAVLVVRVSFVLSVNSRYLFDANRSKPEQKVCSAPRKMSPHPSFH